MCAELPPVDSSIHKSVLQKMIHGPCGAINSNLACMTSGTCRYNYPRKYSETTIIDDGAYPTYRRRSPSNGGLRVKK